MVLELIVIKFSCILKTMSRNTFPEPQPDSAPYITYYFPSPYNITHLTILKHSECRTSGTSGPIGA